MGDSGGEAIKASLTTAFASGLALIPGAGPIIASVANVASTAIQTYQLQQQLQQIDFRLKTMEQKSVEWADLGGDRFQNMLYEVLSLGARNRFESKRAFLSYALCAAAIKPTAEDDHQELYVRTLGALTEREIIVFSRFEELSRTTQREFLVANEVAEIMGVEVARVLVSFDGLAQQGLLYVPQVRPGGAKLGDMDDRSITRSESDWGMTELARALGHFCRSGEQASI